ncbi:MAG TPA: transglutaminase domain-containing protein [Desulfobacteraceae bacterium]|nr:transglutaminase domain-containing protein [Desulfobacteraceae bacterium]
MLISRNNVIFLNHLKRKFFHIAGAVVVAFWLATIGILVCGRGLSSSDGVLLAQAGVGLDGREEEWMEVFLGKNRVGYSVSTINPIESGYLIKEELLLRLRLMGMATSVRTTSTSVVDWSFVIKRFEFQIDSGVVSFRVSGKVRDHVLIVERGSGKNKNTKMLRLKSQPVSSSAIPFLLRSRKPAIGEVIEIPIFDPSSLAEMKILIRAVSTDEVIISGRRYQATKYQSQIMGQPVFFWMSKKGELLKQTGLMGLTLVRSDSDHARAAIGGAGGRELYDIAAVVPDKKILRPRKVRILRVKVKGIPPKEIEPDPNDPRQVLLGDILTVKRENLRAICSEGPNTSAKLRSQLREYLKPELNIESDDELIRAKALEITRGAENPMERARRCLRWIYVNVEKKPVIGIPSAAQTLKTLVGDCNEHAALLAALLRASGIPARVCAGLVYARGKFFYHAWNEAFLGGGWISLDATLNQMPVDATHIKLVQGGLQKQMEILRVMGRLKLEVVEQE